MSAKLIETVRNQNLLKGVALQVYEIIAKKPGLTVGEIAWVYGGDLEKDPTFLGRSRNELAKRVSDLVSWGAVKSVGKTLCPYTNRMANRYAVTGTLPEREKQAKQEVKRLSGQMLQKLVFQPRINPNARFFLESVISKCKKIENSWFAPQVLCSYALQLRLALQHVLEVDQGRGMLNE